MTSTATYNEHDNTPEGVLFVAFEPVVKIDGTLMVKQGDLSGSERNERELYLK